METFQLTRRDMADLLLSLKGEHPKKTLSVLQNAWVRTHKNDIREGRTLAAFIETALPPIFEKLIKEDRNAVGLSINEIVALGNQIEYTNLTPTAVQNWVKRDVKELIGSPQRGKKYTIAQATILFIVEDLKTVLDFESIRKVLRLLFNNPADRSDDLVDPVSLYTAYARLSARPLSVSSPIDTHDIKKAVDLEADNELQSMAHLQDRQKTVVKNVISIAAFAVKTAYLQSLSKTFLNATLFFQDLDP